MGMSATEKLHHLLERTSYLRQRVRSVMRDAGLDPSAATEIIEGQNVRLAFGYLERTPERGVRQRFVEVLVPAAEFGTLRDDLIDRVLEDVERQVGELAHAH